ncbi:MAG: hypothetical protein LBG82_03030 [Clostridiales Family XIII bacterium]|nr:hypothetical protein [Clostridiales Family XIII bacterium]
MGKKRLLAIIVVLSAAVLLFACNPNANAVDYAKPAYWMNLDELNLGKLGDVSDVFTSQEEDLTEVFAYFERHNEISGLIHLGDEGELVVENGIDVSGVESAIIQLLSNCQLKYPSIFVSKNVVQMDMNGILGSSYNIVFNIQMDLSQVEYEKLYGDGVKVAPHWYVIINPPLPM